VGLSEPVSVDGEVVSADDELVSEVAVYFPVKKPPARL